jgi:hypothetical protein
MQRIEEPEEAAGRAGVGACCFKDTGRCEESLLFCGRASDGW